MRRGVSGTPLFSTLSWRYFAGGRTRREASRSAAPQGRDKVDFAAGADLFCEAGRSENVIDRNRDARGKLLVVQQLARNAGESEFQIFDHGAQGCSVSRDLRLSLGIPA